MACSEQWFEVVSQELGAASVSIILAETIGPLGPVQMFISLEPVRGMALFTFMVDLPSQLNLSGNTLIRPMCLVCMYTDATHVLEWQSRQEEDARSSATAVTDGCQSL
ncbi:hypothetical protein STEG23_016243, partial [Scotinomys teguina]